MADFCLGLLDLTRFSSPQVPPYRRKLRMRPNKRKMRNLQPLIRKWLQAPFEGLIGSICWGMIDIWSDNDGLLSLFKSTMSSFLLLARGCYYLDKLSLEKWLIMGSYAFTVGLISFLYWKKLMAILTLSILCVLERIYLFPLLFYRPLILPCKCYFPV